MLSASASVWDFLARSGPEDALRAVPLGRDSSQSVTGGQDFAIARDAAAPTAGLHYQDVSEAQRFISMVESDSCVVWECAPAALFSKKNRGPCLPAPHNLFNPSSSFPRPPWQARESDPYWPAREQKPVRTD
jgi:hypothetical protein